MEDDIEPDKVKRYESKVVFDGDKCGLISHQQLLKQKAPYLRENSYGVLIKPYEILTKILLTIHPR